MTDDRSSGPRARNVVLVVEDDEAISCALVELLEDAGFHAVAASHVETALQALTREAIDAVILDFHLPDGDASDFLAGFSGARPPVVIVSASPQAAALARSSGVRFLAKPFDVDDVLDVVSSLMNVGRQSGAG